jgi:hypothetical protein
LSIHVSAVINIISDLLYDLKYNLIKDFLYILFNDAISFAELFGFK